MRWCGTLFPTNAHAQDAGMSLSSYEDFVYSACHVDTGEAGDALAARRLFAPRPRAGRSSP